jgi:hypothetical protein
MIAEDLTNFYPSGSLASGQTFKIIEENTDKNTDKIARESRGSKNDGMERVEKLGCGGKI